MLSPIQERKISRMFDALDADHDGLLTPADTDRVVDELARQRSWRLGGPEHRALKDTYDVNLQSLREPGGRLDRETYLSRHDQLLSAPGGFEQSLGRIAESVFDVLDADHDGRVSEKELAQLYTAYSIDAKLAPDAFRKLDSDGDGLISRNEMMEAVAQFYLSSDPSAPGNWFLGAF